MNAKLSTVSLSSLNVRRWSSLSPTLLSQSPHTHTHTVGYLAFCQNKRGFSAAALEPLAHLMHLNVSAVVRGHGVGEKPALLIGPKMETQFVCARVINM